MKTYKFSQPSTNSFIVYLRVTVITLALLLPFFVKAQTSWELLGNAGTNPATDFVGTTDNQPVIFKVNSIEMLRLGTTGLATFDAGAYQECALFTGSNWFGNWIGVNSNSANPNAGLGYRFYVNSNIKAQIFFNQGAFSYGTSIDGIAGNTEVLSRAGDVLLSTNLFRTNSLIVKNTTGYVGIGTLSPANKLEITHGTSGNSGLRFTNLTSASTAGSSSGKVLSVNSNGDVVLENLVASHWTLSGSDIYNNNAGNVGIGTNSPAYLLDVNGIGRVKDRLIIGNDTYTFPSDYRLSVKDGIITERLKIRLRADWPDYVFNRDYHLPALKDIEEYIKQNKHLPGIQSAENVKQEGIEVGEMNIKLLQKIEELTLYLIAADKQIQVLQKQILQINQKIN